MQISFNVFKLNPIKQRRLIEQNKQTFNFKINQLTSDTISFSGKIAIKDEIRIQTETIKLVLENLGEKERISQGQLSFMTGYNRSTIQRRIDSDIELKALWDKHKINAHINYSDSEVQAQIDTIKAVLKNFTEDEMISLLKLTSILGLDRGVIQRRIDSDIELKALWDKHKINEHTCYSDDEIKTQIETIKSVLENLDEDEQITLVQLSSIVGCKAGNVANRINSSDELKTLWNKHKTKQLGLKKVRYSNEEIEAQINVIKSALENLGENEKTTLEKLVSITGFNNALIVSRIKMDITLKTLWDKHKARKNVSYSDSEVEAQIEAIKSVLENLEEKEKISQKKLVSITGLSVTTIENRINSNTELKELWDKNKIMDHTSYSDKEVKAQIESVRFILENLEENERISIDELHLMTGLTVGIIRNRIKADAELKTLWAKHKIREVVKYSDQEIKLQIEAIKSVLENLDENKKISLLELASIAGYKHKTVQNRIYSDAELKKLWDKHKTK